MFNVHFILHRIPFDSHVMGLYSTYMGMGINIVSMDNGQASEQKHQWWKFANGFYNECEYMLKTYLLHEFPSATKTSRITCYGANANAIAIAIATCSMCFQWLLNIFFYKILITERRRTLVRGRCGTCQSNSNGFSNKFCLLIHL